MKHGRTVEDEAMEVLSKTKKSLEKGKILEMEDKEGLKRQKQRISTGIGKLVREQKKDLRKVKENNKKPKN